MGFYLGQHILVYQGGHHDVWCDGTRHITMAGGRFGTAPTDREEGSAIISTSMCDCEKYINIHPPSYLRKE